MPKKILLADDSVTIQKVVELTFMEGDYEVTCVSNGKAAVQKIQEARPDILLCDVIMPEMNGYDVAAFVKKNPAYSSIPVILLTGTFEPFDEEKARLSGAETYITKPFDSRLLVEKVEELISRRMVIETAPAEGPVQVFHSRQEFTLEAPPPLAPVPPVEEVPVEEVPVVEEKAFLTPGELEFAMPAETEAPSAEPPIPHPPEPAEPERALPPATAGILSAPVGESESAFESEEVIEALDVGPMSAEDAIPETAFEGIVPPPVPAIGEPGEVVLPPMEAGDLADVAVEAREEPFPEEHARPSAPGPLSVIGAEDWGVSKPFEEVEVGPAPSEKITGMVFDTGAQDVPEVVHAMTEQQEMVSEAQALLGQKQELPVEAAPSEQAFPEEAILSRVEELASPPEPVTDAFEIPPAGGPAPAAPVFAQGPFLPEEGVETGLPEIPPAAEPLRAPEAVEVEATAEAQILHSVPVPAVPEPVLQAEVEPAVIAAVSPGPLEEVPVIDAPGPEPVSVFEAAEPEGEVFPVELAAVPEAAGKEEMKPPQAEEVPTEVLPVPVVEVPASIELEQPHEALPPIEEVPVVAATGPLAGEKVPAEHETVEAPAPERVAMDKEELERLVRMIVEDLAPHLIQQVVSQTAPEIVRQVVSQIAPEAVRTVAQDLIQAEVRKGLDELLPAEVHRAAGESVPGAVERAVAQSLPETVTRAAAETMPSVARDVVGRTAPEIIQQAVKDLAPAAIAESVKAIAEKVVAEEVKQSAAEIVRQVAWEAIPELAESLIKRRIQELESEVG